MYGAKNLKNTFVLVLLIMSGILLGSFVGEALEKIGKTSPSLSFLVFLGKYHDIGITPPFVLKLTAFTLQFGFNLHFSICSVIFMVLAIFIYRKI